MENLSTSLPKTNPLPKVTYTLVDSDKRGEGIVKIFHNGAYPPVTDRVMREEGEIVGIWNRFGDGTYYIEVTTPVEALQDRITKEWSEWVKEDYSLWEKDPSTLPKSSGSEIRKPPMTLYNEERDGCKVDLQNYTPKQQRHVSRKQSGTVQPDEPRSTLLNDLASLRARLKKQ